MKRPAIIITAFGRLEELHVAPELVL